MSDLIELFEGISTGRLAAGGGLTLSAIATALWPKRDKILAWLKSWRPAPAAAVAPPTPSPAGNRDELFAAFRTLADAARESGTEEMFNASVIVAKELCRIPQEGTKATFRVSDVIGPS